MHMPKFEGGRLKNNYDPLASILELTVHINKRERVCSTNYSYIQYALTLFACPNLLQSFYLIYSSC